MRGIKRLQGIASNQLGDFAAVPKSLTVQCKIQKRIVAVENE